VSAERGDRPGPVLVTGANSGIGLATVLRFARRGWDTWGTVRSEAKADDLRREAADAGVSDRLHPLVLDVSDHDAVVASWPQLPPFYGVVNNAGYSEMGAVEDVSAAEAKAQLDVNLVAPAVVSACALPAMRARGSGRIVMVSSIAGRAAIMPLNGWYHASKFGLEALSDVLRMEVAGFGVQVSIVEPGFFKTGIESRANEKAAELAARESSPYREAYRRSQQGLGMIDRVAPPPTLVATTIVAAVESRSPLRRYLVGADALAVAGTQAFWPRGMTDAAARLFTGLTGGRGRARRPSGE
jgi:NAD(P)-dependent dehydrogenase (short-subunit alcohol dehydrogenase family)